MCSIFTFNTCPFDSIFVSIAALYADYETVKIQIDDSVPESKFLEMVSAMFNDTSNITTKQRSLLRKRNDILFSIFKDSKEATAFQNGLFNVNCSANVNYLIQKMLPVTLYSYSRMKNCDKCDKNITSNRCFVDIDLNQYEQQSIKNLNSCLLDILINEKSSVCSCGGTLNINHTYFSNFIIIDLHLKNGIKKISLKDIPKTLELLQVQFSLTACLEYIPMPPDFIDPNKIKKPIGHYVAHILRNNRWERFDDTKSTTTLSNSHLKIEGQVVFYVKND